MRILYFGDPRAVLGLLKAESSSLTICGIVHGRSGGEGARKLVKAIRKHAQSIPRWHLPDLNDSVVQNLIAQTKPDLLVSVFYPRLIPQAILNLAPGINVHPSDLPKWRGPDPSYWVIAHQEKQTAISIHSLTSKLDEGDIVYKEHILVRRRESGGALAVRLERRSAQVMVDFVLKLSEMAQWHTQLKGMPQTGDMSWAPLMDPNDLELDWSRSAQHIDALVRAAAPDPCAFSGLGHELMIIHRGRVAQLNQDTSEHKGSLVPIGQACVDQQRCLIRCGEGFYQLDDVTIGRRRLRGSQLAQLLGGFFTR